MGQRLKFWEVVKKKPLQILGITTAITFLVVKLIDLFLNWYLNRDNTFLSYNYTVSFFSPILFVILFIIVTNIMKRRMNRDTLGIRRTSSYGTDYTWMDIFTSKSSIVFFIIVTLSILVLLDSGLQKLSTMSINYAITSLDDIPGIALLVVSIIAAMYLVVFLQNTIIAWLMNTPKGNKALSILVLVFGILTFAFMCGLNYLWTAPSEVAASFQTDFLLGLVLPFDITTALYGLITFWLWSIAKNCAYTYVFPLYAGCVLAGIGILISLTPAQTVIQTIVITLIHGADALLT